MEKAPCKQKRFCRLVSLLLSMNEKLQIYINGIKIVEPIESLDWDEGYRVLFVYLKRKDNFNKRENDFFCFEFSEIRELEVRTSEGEVICIVKNDDINA